MVAADALRRLRLAVAVLHRQDQPAPLVAVGMTAAEVEAIVTLSAQHVTGRTVEDDDELRFWVEDGGGVAVELTHEIGDPERAATELLRFAEDVRRHALRIRRHARQSQGWT
jgi:hypothetical protein